MATETIEVHVVPALGGRITELTDLVRGRQWMWRNRHVPMGPPGQDPVYDDVWQGGFEELFPNDAPAELAGFKLPDHGETWSTHWIVSEITPTSLAMSLRGPVTGVELSKTYRVSDDMVYISYSLANHSERDLPYLFKLHPALAVHAGCRILLPGGLVEKVDPDFGNITSGEERTPWPTKDRLDLCRLESSRTNDFVYVHDLPSGWCGIIDDTAEAALTIDFPIDVFPYCWIFMTYGGWRGHSVVVLEPCTTYPKDLNDALRRGSTPLLGSAARRDFEITVRVGPRE